MQDLKYDTKQGEVLFAAFDAYDSAHGHWLDYDQLVGFCNSIQIPMVPILYRGPWSGPSLDSLAGGKSIIASNIREGFVVQPTTQRFSDELGGRIILKMVSEAYLLRKGGTEHH